MAVWVLRLIPAYTGQIAEAVRTDNSPPIHPRVYGADTKLLKKISEIAEHPLLPQNPMIESVCVIFSECMFADDTFWSFSMFFCKKEMPAAPLSHFAPLLHPGAFPLTTKVTSIHAPNYEKNGPCGSRVRW